MRLNDREFIKENILNNLGINIDILDTDFINKVKKSVFEQLSPNIKTIWKIISDAYNIFIHKDERPHLKHNIQQTHLNFNQNQFCPIDHLLNNGCCVKMNSKINRK